MKSILFAAGRWCTALAIFIALPALAAADPPARVGRLADVAGQVWIYDRYDGEWIVAARNRPITSGDRFSTEQGARAEVQVGSIVWRLDGDSELEVIQLDDDAVRLQLTDGSVAVRARTEEAAREVELVTPEGRFVPQRAGHFRVDRDGDVSAATVWSGAVNFRSDDSELDIGAGQRTEFWKDGGRTHYTRLEPARDSFAEWALAAEREFDRGASSRYASPEMPGIDDLDRYGRWERSTDYGWLWAPYAIAPGWVPYRYGHWAYVGPWGWSWVDDAPWGFAPFHYGRWVYWGSRWCWAPGSFVRRPVYAPALVAWVGGPRASLSIGFGARGPVLGWFPLGPREVFVPSYRVSPVYIRNVNITHVPHVDPALIRQPTMIAPNQRFANRFAPNAMTAVAADVIGGRRNVAEHVDPRLVREVEREPVSATLPVAALAARRQAAVQAVVPAAPNRDAAPRVTRPHGERPGRIVPPVAAVTPSPAAPSLPDAVPRALPPRGAPTGTNGQHAVPPSPRSAPMARIALPAAVAPQAAVAPPAAVGPPVEAPSSRVAPAPRVMPPRVERPHVDAQRVAPMRPQAEVPQVPVRPHGAPPAIVAPPVAAAPPAAMPAPPAAMPAPPAAAIARPVTPAERPAAPVHPRPQRGDQDDRPQGPRHGPRQREM